MYRITDFAKLHHISHIIWDIDGTITDENGEVSQEVAAKIINLALEGIYHSFITGRDAKWIIEKVINPMKKFFNFTRARDGLVFFAEVGCIMININPAGDIEQRVNSAVENHPLAMNKDDIREKIRSLVYDPRDLQEYQLGMKISPSQELVYDANREGLLIDRSQGAPPCHPYIWSIYKEVFATFEKIRDEAGKVQSFDQTPYEEIVGRVIQEAGFQDSIAVEVVSTAINIVPKVDGLKLGKSWAAGSALQNIQQQKLGGAVLLEEVVAKTVAGGDGIADLDFTVPTFPAAIGETLKRKNLQIIFVGGEQDLPHLASPTGELCNNIIIQATGKGNLEFNWPRDIIELHAAKGARVISAVLDFLKQWEYFRHF